MGFGDWLSSKFEAAKAFGKKAVEETKKFIGKARGAAQKGVQLYEQGKDIYEQGKGQYAQAKGQLSSLPVIGKMASEQLGKLEGQAGQLIEKAAEKGLSSQNAELAAGLARRFVRETRNV
jgi:hypothetical protein